jgi:conjugal transfer mating pair stabilization protein TraN
MNAENRQFVTTGLKALLGSAGFSGTFTTYGVTIAVNGAALPAGSTVLYSSSAAAGQGVVIAFDPWSLALMVVIYIIISMMSCNESEGRMALQEGAGLCHEIGTFCSSCIRVLGRCVRCIERSTGKCCFNSMLSRIINEQGRAQIGKGWGSAQAPDCSGFTVAQLPALNFAAMNFSEFYASLTPTMPDLDTLRSQSASKVSTCYYGAGKCATP